MTALDACNLRGLAYNGVNLSRFLGHVCLLRTCTNNQIFAHVIVPDSSPVTVRGCSKQRIRHFAFKETK